MMKSLFVSDLHGHHEKYIKLFNSIKAEKPNLVFIGGDILLSGHAFSKSLYNSNDEFLNEFLIPSFEKLRLEIHASYPEVFIIMGNDDAKIEEKYMLLGDEKGIWNYIHGKKKYYKEFSIYGYSYVPPTPFQLKDWERYDVSRYIDPGCIAPNEGIFTVPIDEHELIYSTIQEDLIKLTNDDTLENSIFLFHSPPYKTNLDQANLEGMKFDNVEIDINVGSIAIRKFIEKKQPFITLHGHIHESPKITGYWKDQIGKTICFSAAHDGKELALVKFDLENPKEAVRELI